MYINGYCMSSHFICYSKWLSTRITFVIFLNFVNDFAVFSQITTWCQSKNLWPLWIFFMCPLKESAWVNDLHKIHIWNLYHLHEQFSCVLMKGWYCFQNNCYKYHICWNYHFKNYYVWRQNELLLTNSNQTKFSISDFHSFYQIIFPA